MSTEQRTTPRSRTAAAARPHERVTRRRPGRPAGGPAVTDRERILDAAEQLIAAVGPNVSMEAVAVAADVSKPTLYQHLGNRDALVEALAARYVRRIDLAVGAAVRDAVDARDRVRRFVTAYFTVVDAQRHLYVFLATGSAGDTASEHAMAFADHAARSLARVIARQRIADGADPAVADDWAYALVGALHYVTLRWIRDPRSSVQQVTEHVIELLWGGLGAPPSPAPTPRTRRSSKERARP